MPVFISYAHEDKDLAHRLALQLVRHRAYVWIDEWELNVGDSIIEKIQGALTEASALLVVLSPSSVESPWCKRELTAGLLRELEEKRVIVLPVLMKDCDIPLFLRDKMYADFRGDFDAGLSKVLEALAGIASEGMGRVEDIDGEVDYSMDWDLRDDKFDLSFTVIDRAKDYPFTLLTQMKVTGNEHARRRYLAFAEAGLDWIEQVVILEALAECSVDGDFRVLLEDARPKTQKIEARSGTHTFFVDITARRVGADIGRDVLLDLGEQLRRIRDVKRSTTRPLTSEEQRAMLKIREDLGER